MERGRKESKEEDGAELSRKTAETRGEVKC